MSYVLRNNTQRFFWTFTGWRAKISVCEKPYRIYRFMIDHNELVSIRTRAKKTEEEICYEFDPTALPRIRILQGSQIICLQV